MNPAKQPSCAILVPSYGRAPDLARCLTAIAAQSVSPNQVIVVVRPDDSAAREVIASASPELPLTQVFSGRPGQVAALNAGLRAVTCDITAITDDDAAPSADWLARLRRHFADSRVAAVGGRDVVIWNGAVVGVENGLTTKVGRVRLYGRIVGNHHRGTGPVRQVDVLKGANMAFRTTSLRRIGFDERLRGTGAQVHNDLMLSLQIRRTAELLLYDPDVMVYHYPAPRPAGDAANDRTPASAAALSDEIHNETLALMEFLPRERRVMWLVWCLLWGTRRAPGMGIALLLFPSRPAVSLRTLLACYRGRASGISAWWIAR